MVGRKYKSQSSLSSTTPTTTPTKSTSTVEHGGQFITHDHLLEIKSLLQQNLISINQRHDELENKLTDCISEITVKLNNIETSIQSHVSKNTANILELKETVLGNTKDIKAIKHHNGESISTIEQTLNDQQKKISKLQEQLEDQTNRNMRSTLILKDIHQTHPETWNETIDVLSDALQNHCEKLTKDYVKGAIERAHRGKSNDDGRPPTIFLKLKS